MLRPALGNPPHRAYPSGHSFQVHSMAEMPTRLALEVGPAAAPVVATHVAENREHAGLNGLSDTEAGRLLAQQVLPNLREVCRGPMLAARGEWIG